MTTAWASTARRRLTTPLGRPPRSFSRPPTADHLDDDRHLRCQKASQFGPVTVVQVTCSASLLDAAARPPASTGRTNSFWLLVRKAMPTAGHIEALDRKAALSERLYPPHRLQRVTPPFSPRVSSRCVLRTAGVVSRRSRSACGGSSLREPSAREAAACPSCAARRHAAQQAIRAGRASRHPRPAAGILPTLQAILSPAVTTTLPPTSSPSPPATIRRQWQGVWPSHVDPHRPSERHAG